MDSKSYIVKSEYEAPCTHNTHMLILFFVPEWRNNHVEQGLFYLFQGDKLMGVNVYPPRKTGGFVFVVVLPWLSPGSTNCCCVKPWKVDTDLCSFHV